MPFSETNPISASKISIDGNVERILQVPAGDSFAEELVRQLLPKNYRGTYPPALCIGYNIQLGDGSSIDAMYATPTGNLIIVDSDATRAVVNAKLLQTFDAEKLDSVVSDFTYLESGIGYRVFDLMLRDGYLYSRDEKTFTGLLNANLSNADFLTVVADRK